MAQLYDKTGGVFVLDHEHEGTAYVRPMVKVFTQYGYGDDVHEDESVEPAAYLVAMDRAALFDAPPEAVVDADIAAKQSELNAMKAEAEKAVRDLKTAKAMAERELSSATRQLEYWMQKHRVMMDLGKLLDGQVLYPLSISKNHYHHGPSVPHIPSMRRASYLTLTSGNFEEGKKWACKQYASDNYGSEFQFFDTEEERLAVIRSEFGVACDRFRKNPNFETASYTTGTTLHYGTLLEWVSTHPALQIPDDIKAMKAAHDAALVEQRKAKLAAELAALATSA